MLWLLPTAAAYLLKAASDIYDKILLDDKKALSSGGTIKANWRIPNPISLTFYSAIAGFLAFVLAPFGFTFVSWPIFLLTLVTGCISNLSFLFLYKALARGEASRVVTGIGALVPIVTFVLAHFLLGERLLIREILGLMLILWGVYILGKDHKGHADIKFITIIAWAAFFSAFTAILIKTVYLHESFINGLIWMRVGAVIGGFGMLLYGPWKRTIFETNKTLKASYSINFFIARLFSSSAGILINLAILIGPVTLVMGLAGLEYVFLFLATMLLSYKFPYILKEDVSYFAMVRKFIGVAVVSIGLFFIGVRLF